MLNDNIIVIIIFGIVILVLCNSYFSENPKILNIPPIIIPSQTVENFTLNTDLIKNGALNIRKELNDNINKKIQNTKNKIAVAQQQIGKKINNVQTKVATVQNNIKQKIAPVLVSTQTQQLLSTPPTITTQTKTIIPAPTYADDRLHTNDARTVKYPDSDNIVKYSKVLFPEKPVIPAEEMPKSYINPVSIPPQNAANNLPPNKEVCQNKSIYINNSYYLLKDGLQWNAIDSKYNACGNPYTEHNQDFKPAPENTNFEYDDFDGTPDNPADFDFANYYGNRLVKMRSYLEDPETRGANIGYYDKYASIGDIGNIPLSNKPKNPYGAGYVFKPMNEELK